MTDYYVDGAVGDDGNLGTSEGAGNAWATIEKAIGATPGASGGDTVYIKASVTYSEDVTANFTGGTSTIPTVIEGYATTPGDMGRVTWSGTTTCLTIGSSMIFAHWHNFNFQDCSSSGVTSLILDGAHFLNCRFTNNAGFGFTGDNSHSFYFCQFDGNTNYGVDGDNALHFYFCKMFNNAAGGISVATITNLIGMLFSGGGENDITVHMTSGFNGGRILWNTFDGETVTGTSGFELTAATNTGQALIIGNLFHDYNDGFDFHPSYKVSHDTFVGWNSFSNCTTNGDVGKLDNFPWNDKNNIDAPALFTDEAGGDYTLGPSSTHVDAGPIPGLLT